MATFYEIYQNYLQNPYGGVNALPGVNAISGTMGATPISSMSGGDGVGEVSSVSPVGSVSNVGNVGGFGNVDTSAKGIAGLAASGLIGGPFGLAANVVGQMIGMPSVSDVVGRAMAGLGIGGDSTSTGTANATDTGDMGSEAANNAATDAANASVGAGDGSSSDGGSTGSCGSFKNGGYITGASVRPNLNMGGRVGYAEGSITQEGVIPGFEKIRDTVYFNPDGTPNLEKIKAANFLPGSSINEFGYRDIKTGDTYGQSTYADIASGRYPRIFDPSKYTIGPDNNYYEVDSIITDGGLRYRINADGSRTLLDTTIAQTTPTEDFSDYLNTTTINTNVQTAPTIAEQIISTNNSSPALTSVAETLFPQGDFLNIRETAASPTEYNIEATKDLVENLPGGIVKDIVAPTAAFALSLPYDAIQAYQRMEPGSGIGGFKKAFQAERPLESAFERFTGAAGPLAENINTAISSLNPFQKQQYMNYAVQNPDQAIAAAQRNKDFLAATQKNTNPATPAPASMADGGRVFYLQGGLASLLG
jgi:hypothetical protein